MGALVVIPARVKSARLARKAMLPCAGYPLFWHTWAAVTRWDRAVDVVVATADDEIKNAAKRLGVTVVGTQKSHRSGTSRACEAAMSHDWEGAWVVNVQADHPRITHGALDAVLETLRRYPADRSVVATAAGPLAAEHLHDRNRVKAVVDDFREARWFTRLGLGYAYHHVGVYAWHRAACRTLMGVPQSAAGEAEQLEQLDWLQAGWTVPVAMLRHAGDGIDDAGDIQRFRAEVEADAVPER